MKIFLVLLSLFHHHWTAIIFDFQNVVTAFSSEFLFLNVFFNFHIFIDILFRILIACKYHTTFNVLFLIFNDQWICRFSLCRRVSVLFFFQKPSYIYINKPTYADPVIKRSSAKWVFCKCSKSCRKNISLSELIFANFEFIRESLWK